METKPSTRGENLSVIGALGAAAVRAAMSIPGAVDGAACLVFTQAVLAPSLHPGDIVFMDNVPTHKMPAIAAALTAVGARVKFLPPYSPTSRRSSSAGRRSRPFCAALRLGHGKTSKPL